MGRLTTGPKNAKMKKAITERSLPNGSSWTPDHYTRGAKPSRPASSKSRSRAESELRYKRPGGRGWIIVAELLIVLGVLFFVGRMLLTSPAYNIRHLQIDGLNFVKTSVVQNAADIPGNQNIFLYIFKQRKALCERLTECNPAIQDAVVGVDLPNTLVLHVQEREPYTVLHLQNGKSYLMDSSRIPFKLIAPNQSQLPIVTVPADLGSIVEGASLPAAIDDHVAAAYNLLTLLAGRQIGALADFREVIVDPYDNVSLKLDNGLLVKLGQYDGMSQRLTDLETAMIAQPSLVDTAQYLDFTTSRYAIMKKPGPVTALSGDEQPTGQISPLSAVLGH